MVGEIAPLQLKGLRIGVPKKTYWDNLDAETSRIAYLFLEKLKNAGVILVEGNIPDVNKLDSEIDLSVALFEFKKNFAPFFAGYDISADYIFDNIGSSDVKEIINSYVRGKNVITEAAYLNAKNNLIPKLAKLYQNFYDKNKVDFIIFPTTPTHAKLIAEDPNIVKINGKSFPAFPTYVRNTSPTGDVGAADISIPIGLNKLGLPIGIEIDTFAKNDKNLLKLSLAIENLIEPIAKPKEK